MGRGEAAHLRFQAGKEMEIKGVQVGIGGRHTHKAASVLPGGGWARHLPVAPPH